jgi:hypothetical protein
VIAVADLPKGRAVADLPKGREGNETEYPRAVRWWLLGFLLFLTALLVADATLVPMVGIMRASRRLERRQPSKGAVTWAGVNVVVFGLLTVVLLSVGGFHPVVAGGLVLNGLWLLVALRTNRAARTP